MMRDTIDDTLDWLAANKHRLILEIIEAKEDVDKRDALTTDAAHFDHAHMLIRRAFR
jgi:hypothetical protein